eukprot:COSAG04_NODE_2222_length_4500_cov_4.688480_1_plen_63_part_10
MIVDSNVPSHSFSFLSGLEALHGLRWLGRAPTAFSLRTAFGAPFSHRVFAFRCCLCFRHSYLT